MRLSALIFHETAPNLRNNLVAWQNRYGHKNRSHRAILDAKADNALGRTFEQWFFDFVKDSSTDEEAFESLRKRYDLIAYMTMMKNSTCWTRTTSHNATSNDGAWVDLRRTSH